MEKVVVGIVEDELIIANHIADTLKSLGYGTAGPVINYTTAIDMLDNHKPDIVLLDIILSGRKDGVDLAKKIKESYDIPFVFLTSHADKLTIEKAKKVDPSAYLIKPFNKDELYSAIEIAMFNFKGKNDSDDSNSEGDGLNRLFNDSLFIKDKHHFVKINFEDILYLENDHVYINVVTDEGVHLIRSNMSEFLKKFPSNFYRVHRSYAVNLNYLTAINSEVVFIKDVKIPVSSSYRKELLSRIDIS